MKKMNTLMEEILVRDLNTLKTEISAFKNEADLWRITGEIKNPAGALSHHLCGNLRHFIGAILGKTGYVRNRDLEFSQRDIAREELLKNIDETLVVIKNVLADVHDSQMNSIYPQPFLGKEVLVVELLLILTSHLSYHLGQINYLRRMLNQ